ncbi:hypothetical protein HYC85_004035 [Camellia sinensis]|uniref:DNA-directed RNA polymerase III subunit RPC6 n=1 Tax=Camellia sinensis TaxID=4442 RepID=A0A7J7HVC3_CAMSI|nr:hypothetical protein HYC85_004035 [Camellia sinensis]
MKSGLGDGPIAQAGALAHVATNGGLTLILRQLIWFPYPHLPWPSRHLGVYRRHNECPPLLINNSQVLDQSLNEPFPATEMSRSQESPSLKRKRPEPNTHAQTPESVLLNLIKSKGDMGIWKGDMKRETSLPEPVVNKAIKTLQGKALIKEVVNIKSKGRKHFMAAEFEPSKELTGGAWYVEGKLDQEFIAVLKDSCSKIIRKLKVVTAEGISDFIKRNKITTIECKTHQIEEILKSMVLDNEIFEVKSTGLGEYHSIPIGTACYRSSTGMGLGQGPKIGAMASIPCGNFLDAMSCSHLETCLNVEKVIQYICRHPILTALKIWASHSERSMMKRYAVQSFYFFSKRLRFQADPILVQMSRAPVYQIEAPFEFEVDPTMLKVQQT